MASESEIKQFLKENGPATPVQLGKKFGVAPLIASAMFADLSSRGIVKISSLKIGGGSPLYFLPEQKPLLENFITGFNDKDRQTFQLIKEKKVIRDIDMPAIVRISLRTIKDFALPLEVTVKAPDGDKEVLFWKWYELEDTVCNKYISAILKGQEPQKEATREEQEPKKIVSIQKESKTEINLDKKKKKEKTPKINITETAPIKKIESTQKLQISNQNVPEKSVQKVVINPTTEHTPSQHTAFIEHASTGFIKQVAEYCKEKGVIISAFDIIKKNKEYTATILVPSVISNTKYYAKIIDKKKITEGELAIFALHCQQKMLPGVYIIPQELSPKVEEITKTMCKDVTILVVKK